MFKEFESLLASVEKIHVCLLNKYEFLIGTIIFIVYSMEFSLKENFPFFFNTSVLLFCSCL